jgi:hypothetical protein
MSISKSAKQRSVDSAQHQVVDDLLSPLSDRRPHTRRSLASAAAEYVDGAQFAALAPTTQIVYRRVIERVCRHKSLCGLPVRQISPAHIEHFTQSRASTPASQADALKKLHLLFRAARDRGWCAHDPTSGPRQPIRNRRPTWSRDHIAAFEARWPIGTRQRLAFDLLVRVGLPGHHVVALTVDELPRWKIPPAHAHQPHRKNPTALTRPEYALTTNRGRPFSAGGFGKFMARAIADAGLSAHCVADSPRQSPSDRGGTP